MNPMRPTLRHNIIKMATVNDKENLKAERGGKKSHIQGNPISLLVDFSTEIL